MRPPRAVVGHKTADRHALSRAGCPARWSRRSALGEGCRQLADVRGNSRSETP